MGGCAARFGQVAENALLRCLNWSWQLHPFAGVSHRNHMLEVEAMSSWVVSRGMHGLQLTAATHSEKAMQNANPGPVT